MSQLAASAACTSSGWRPILDGEIARQAWESIDAIAEGVRRWYSQAQPARDADATLAGGSAGAAVFFDYLARARGNQSDRDTASELLRDASKHLTAATRGAGLHEGYAGVIWSATHLRGSEFDTATEAHLSRVDTAILNLLGQPAWQEPFDLIGGLVGYGVYARERLPRPAAVECLSLVVEWLEETAERRPDGITWKTPHALMPDGQREQLPNGWYNLGVAHGVPGIIALLSEACAANVAAERARPLLNGAVEWLLRQRLPDGAGAYFPHCIARELPAAPSRLAWCFGDAGIAATLLLAARRANEPAWTVPALEIAHHAASRAFDTTGVEDAGLCHGAAGLAHVFNRMFQATGEPWLGEATQTWFVRTLGMRQPGREVGGFPASEPGHGEAPVWTPDPGFLTGSAGVGLALLAAVSEIEPAWDRTLLLSIPLGRAPANCIGLDVPDIRVCHPDRSELASDVEGSHAL